MTQLAVFIAGGALAGVLIGFFAGALVARRQMRRDLGEIGEDVVRMQRLAEGRLMRDEPDLPEMLRELDFAVDNARKALAALEGQSQLARAKSEDARVLADACRHVLSRMDDLGVETAFVPAAKAKEISAKLEAPVAKKKAEPALR